MMRKPKPEGPHPSEPTIPAITRATAFRSTIPSRSSAPRAPTRDVRRDPRRRSHRGCPGRNNPSRNPSRGHCLPRSRARKRPKTPTEKSTTMTYRSSRSIYPTPKRRRRHSSSCRTRRSRPYPRTRSACNPSNRCRTPRSPPSSRCRRAWRRGDSSSSSSSRLLRSGCQIIIISPWRRRSTNLTWT